MRRDLLPRVNQRLKDQIEVSSPMGHRSTRNKRRVFSVLVTRIGESITRVNTAANGDEFLINRHGIYSVKYLDRRTNGSMSYGVSLNTSQFTTGINSITAVNRISHSDIATAEDSGTRQLEVAIRLIPGDVLRPHDDGNNNGTGTNLIFRVMRLAD